MRGCIDEILDASPITSQMEILVAIACSPSADTRSEANDVLQKFMRSGIAGAIARHTDPSGLQIHVGTTRVFPGRN
jgi:hypothetical protein